jgi:glycosyltransferase involved in cell wall biosynthesis
VLHSGTPLRRLRNAAAGGEPSSSPHRGSPEAEGARHARVVVDGKHFAVDGRRFPFHGVTYGTFRPRHGDGALFPPRRQIEHDFAAMRDAGFTVVRTYTPPQEDVIELAGESCLRLLPDVFYSDWRYLLGASRRDYRRIAKEARGEVRAVARQLAGDSRILALSVGCEIPADVVRWVGTSRVARLIGELVEVAREEDPGLLVTYANYPTAEYLPLDTLDFLTFNVFLEQQADFRRYLTRLHHLAGERPLVLAEVGLNAGPAPEGELAQARVLDWQLATALERGVAGTCVFSWTDDWWVGDSAVEGWHFGITRADRSPRPALGVTERWNRATIADLKDDWPSISIVVCAYNASETLDECLHHVCALDYPDLEIIVVDDGSTDDTAEIARGHPRVKLVEIEHAGLSVARNEGLRRARGELVAYLDSDAYPTPEWPYYLALGLDGRTVGGVGGPNVPPICDCSSAQQVARAPGGPVHVLVADNRAEHVPGCNMAFWKQVLEEVGGFDPVYTAAGDDVDLCWKVGERGWEIGFHPAALVWHHARPGIRRYLRQQRTYGRAEALVEARHPHRFTATGSARWRGRIYEPFAGSLLGQRIYRGMYGTAAYQSVYQGNGHGMGLLRQIGVPIAALVMPTGAMALRWPLLSIPAAVALAVVAALFMVDAARVRPPPGTHGCLRFRCAVALLGILQPLARTWGRIRQRTPARQSLPPQAALPDPVNRLRGGVLLMPEDRPREELAVGVVRALRCAGLAVFPASSWDDHDARLIGSTLVRGELVTSSYPLGCVQLRVRRRVRRLSALTYAGAFGMATLVDPVLLGTLIFGAFVETLRGLWRTGPAARRAIGRAVT